MINENKKTLAPSCELSQLPNELLTSIFSKMVFSSFLNCRMASRWIHNFIEDFRDKINVQFPCKDVVLSPNGIGLGWTGCYRIFLPMKELMAIRPQRVNIRGWAEKIIKTTRRRNAPKYKVYSWKTRKLRRAFAVLRKLRWHEGLIKLSDLKENALLVALDELTKCGIPTGLDIDKSYWPYTSNISRHSMLSLVPSLHLRGCASPDLSLLLSNRHRLFLHCSELANLHHIKSFFKNLSAGSLKCDRLWMQFRLDYDPTAEFLDGIPHTLLWTHADKENSIIQKKFPFFNKRTNAAYNYSHFSIPTADGKCIAFTMNGIGATVTRTILLCTFESEDEVIDSIANKYYDLIQEFFIDSWSL